MIFRSFYAPLVIYFIIFIILAARFRIIRAFDKADAFSESSAKNLEELGLRFFAAGIFNNLEKQGIIIKTSDDKYYKDKTRYDTWKKKQRTIAFIVCAILVVVTICLIIFVSIFYPS